MGDELDQKATLAFLMDRLLRRFHSEMHPRAQQVDAEKIGPIGGMILLVISEHSAITARSIGEALGRDKSQVSRMVSLLMQKGLVEKTLDQRDARVSQLSLTDKGALQVAAFNGALVETTRSVLEPLSPDDVAQFSALLEKILSSPAEHQAK